MKGLSIKEPWAMLIYKGNKTIETRTWKTGYRGKILLCASKKPTSYLSGKAFATANLVDIIPMTKRHIDRALCDVYEGAYAWMLENITPILKPFKIKGRLNLFHVSDCVLNSCDVCELEQCPEECFNCHEGSMISLRKLSNASGKKVYIIGERREGKNYLMQQEWSSAMYRLLNSYRVIGLTEREVFEYIGKELGYNVINQKGKPITFKVRSYNEKVKKK